MDSLKSDFNYLFQNNKKKTSNLSETFTLSIGPQSLANNNESNIFSHNDDKNNDEFFLDLTVSGKNKGPKKFEYSREKSLPKNFEETKKHKIDSEVENTDTIKVAMSKSPSQEVGRETDKTIDSKDSNTDVANIIECSGLSKLENTGGRFISSEDLETLFLRGSFPKEEEGSEKHDEELDKLPDNYEEGESSDYYSPGESSTESSVCNDNVMGIKEFLSIDPQKIRDRLNKGNVKNQSAEFMETSLLKQVPSNESILSANQTLQDNSKA
ncbi:hypothetical protein BB560_002730 [Smittium megazygosporum]|uniref:Uncharacterized protein n=1 Tax=Smittium megazygosporum TaxID=133381 RepID=A0A2T9ZDZ2_9FUNG|nr:hypothetical protein BB560_002730 [Smittium megazygosporum]